MTLQKTWMITGGNRGLGRALTLSALDARHAVATTVRGEHTLPAHEHLMVLRLDVRDRTAVQTAVTAVHERFGRLDVLVNNAGYGLIGTAEEVSEEEVRSIVGTNLVGPLWLSQSALPIMRRQGSGHIVQISTVGAVGTMPTLGLCNATKSGLEAFSEAMAAEVGRFGIRVSVIEPGALATDWAGRSMRFSSPVSAYDSLRNDLFGTSEVPWPQDQPMDGTSPTESAAAIITHVGANDDQRFRVFVGDDAPGQVRAALDLRLDDYARDDRFPEH